MALACIPYPLVRYSNESMVRAHKAGSSRGTRVLRPIAVSAFALSAAVGLAQGGESLGAIGAELRQHRPADALRDADGALKAHPDDPRLWTMKGLAAKELGRPPLALSAFEAALRLSPDYLPALEGAAEIAYTSDPDKARSFVDRLLLQLPDDPTVNGLAAMLSYRGGDWKAAVEHFAKAGEAVLSQRPALEAYADSLGRLDRAVDAEPLFKRLVEQWPEDQQARYNLAVLELRGKQPGAALETLRPLTDAHNPASLSLAAAAYEAAGDTPSAVTTLRDAIQRSPADPQNYLDFAALSFDHSSFAAGIAMLDAGLTQLPRSAPLFVARGILYMQSSQVERAARDFEMANRLDPSQSFGLEAQGLTDLQRHDLPAALARVRESLRQDPKSAYLNYLAAQILKEQGAPPHSPNAASAETYATRAVELDPTLVAARNLLSGLLFESGDLARAQEQCRAALRLDPSDQEAVYRLILILRRNGDGGHEIAALVESLKKLRAEEHSGQVKLDRYRLVLPPATSQP